MDFIKKPFVPEVLLLHPVLVMKRSSIRVGSVQIGTREHTREDYISKTLRRPGEIDRRLLFLVIYDWISV